MRTGGTMRAMSKEAGWYPDADRPGMLRYFDGHAWTQRRRAANGTSGPDVWTIARGVALGVLVAVAILYVLGRLLYG